MFHISPVGSELAINEPQRRDMRPDKYSNRPNLNVLNLVIAPYHELSQALREMAVYRVPLCYCTYKLQCFHCE